MKSSILVVAFFVTASTSRLPAADSHWNQFRGPEGDGVSSASRLPIQFDEFKNVRWKTAIAGSGWSSPVIWDNEIWLTTGDLQTGQLRALCVDAQTGTITKDIKVFEMLDRVVDPAYEADSPHLNSPATPTPVVDDDYIYVSYGSQGIACLDRETGQRRWERRDLRIYQPVRQGSSPVVDRQNLYLAFDGNDQQFFIALDKRTGRTRWRADRNVQTALDAKLQGTSKPGDNKKSFATAQLITVQGQRQLIAPAGEATIAYDPDSGDEIWRVMHPGGFNVAARPIHANGLVYVITSGISQALLAIDPSGRGDVTDTHVAWSLPRSSPNIPSPIVVGKRLFMVTDKGGIVRCLDATTGDEIWRERLGGNHWASPLFNQRRLYFCGKNGEVVVLPATMESPEPEARNQLDASFIASPAVAGSSLILRSRTHLYCIADGYRRSEEAIADESRPKAHLVADQSSAEMNASKEIDWDAIYEKALQSNPAIGRKVDAGDATKAQVIEYLQRMRSETGKGMSSKSKKQPKPGATKGNVNFYAIVIGRLMSKDIELGELELNIDFVLSSANWAKERLVGKRVRLVGVAGPFLDNLLEIKRGETVKVRTGSYDADANTLGFGYKFQVLERTPPFQPSDFGVPPDEFRGFQGELGGKVVEALGYEVLLEVSESKSAHNSQALDATAIHGKRIRIEGFYIHHQEMFADLHAGDFIRVSVAHRQRDRDAVSVTNVLRKSDP
ncbi:MAG: PQQ-binding-like beta-propeller repeat protein [Planctomycetota bacterium]